MPPKHDPAARMRVLRAAREGKNWRLVAEHNDIRVSIASRWVLDDKRGIVRGTHGGKRNVKVKPEHVEFLEWKLSLNPNLSMEALREALEEAYGLHMTAQPIKPKLDGACIVLDQAHKDVDTMNTEENKRKRKDFVHKVNVLMAKGKHIFYFDEASFNVWTLRAFGGQFMQAIICIGKEGPVHHEFYFGRRLAENMKSFVEAMMQKLVAKYRREDIVVVADVSPFRELIEKIFQRVEYYGAMFLPLEPYSPMINPAEDCLATFRQMARNDLTANRAKVLDTPASMTDLEHRRHMLEFAAQRSIGPATSPASCLQYYSATAGFYASILQEQDMHL